MSRLLIRSVVLVLVLVLIGTDTRAQTFRSTSVTILADGGRYGFQVELAETPEQRRVGLQGRKSLPVHGGMLFDFDRPRMVAMWMKDTPLSLDMVFIRADGLISSIARNTVPGSQEVIGSREPVRAVLELPGGTTERLGIDRGDRVQHWIFNNAS